DTQAVINALIALGVIKPTGDALTLRRAIGYFINNLARQTERQETIQAIGEDLFSIAVDQPFRFPATFTFVLRAFSTLEGIGKSLNPTYRFTDVATPYAQELLQLQAATLNVVGGMGFVNVATVLGTTGHEGPALACLLLGCVFGVLTWRGFVRVERLDKFEKDLRG
ncbi:ABC1 domain-containing protein, partial [Haematococcus lacustris]